MHIIFIQNLRIHITENVGDDKKESIYHYNLAQGLNKLNLEKLKINPCIKVHHKHMGKLLQSVRNSRLTELDVVIFLVDDYKKTKQVIKDNFKIIKAAGGIVSKEDQVLLIRRFNQWDLPKGKLNKQEKKKKLR